MVGQRATVLRELIKAMAQHTRDGREALVSAWQLERQVFLYAQGAGCNAWSTYTFKAIEMVHHLDSHKDPLGDVTRLPWLPPSVLDSEGDGAHQQSANAACRVRWDTMRRLQEVCLKVPEDVRGGMRCRKCGSNDLLVETHQTRAADEGMTQFVTCKRCGAKW